MPPGVTLRMRCPFSSRTYAFPAGVENDGLGVFHRGLSGRSAITRESVALIAGESRDQPAGRHLADGVVVGIRDVQVV